MNEQSVDAIRDAARFAHRHSPFYRELYDRNGVNPETVPLPHGLPTVSPLDLVQQGLRFRTDIPAFKVSASSGTTGRPKLMFRTEKDFEKSVQNQIELMCWSQVVAGDVVAIAQPFSPWGYGDLTMEATRRMGALALPVGLISDFEALQMMLTVGATVLDVSPSRLRGLVQLSSDLGMRDRLSVRSVMVAGEPPPATIRAEVKDAWGADLFNQYGSEETDGLGGQRTIDGQISLFEDDFIFELLNESGLPVPDGEIGQLVVTSLYHQGTPLVRYKLGDLVQRCPPNRSELTVLGKAGEYLPVYDSVKLFPYQVDDVLTRNGISTGEWQCLVDDDGHCVQITLVLPARLQSSVDGERIQDAMSHCCIDVEALTSKGDLVFNVTVQESFIVTPRGKTRKFIDRRPRSTSPVLEGYHD